MREAQEEKIGELELIATRRHVTVKELPTAGTLDTVSGILV
jgi:hypothetical protein